MTTLVGGGEGGRNITLLGLGRIRIATSISYEYQLRVRPIRWV